MRIRVLALAALCLAATATAQPAPTPRDPFRWLEEVDSPRALAQVRAWNARTAARLEPDPAFAAARARALAILNDPRQIALPQIHGDRVVNFWQDAAHVKGLWRTASLASYLAGAPDWRTLVDLDSLARTESRNWVWKGAVCRAPDYARCMIGLSDGGSDALTYREFDVAEARFVPGGFATRPAKTTLAWAPDDALLVQSDFGAGTLTASGYGRQVRLWRRGASLAAVRPLAEASAADVGLTPRAFHDGGRLWPILIRQRDFWRSSILHVRADGALVPSPLPPDATPEAVVRGRLVARLFGDWKTAGGVIPSGSVVAYDIAALEAGRQPAPEIVFTSDRQTAIAQVDGGDGLVWLSLLDNVAGRLAAVRLAEGGPTDPSPSSVRGGGPPQAVEERRASAPQPSPWTASTVAMPPNSTVTLIDSDGRSDFAFVQVSSLTQPSTLYAVRPGATPRAVAQLPPQFDGARFAVTQRFAVSPDGTRVPYFLVRPKDAAGPLPTLVHAYGGFRSPTLPAYPAALPILWLESGGAYVIANIRGGGEYGPSWHEAGLRQNRQRVFDDFYAVGDDLRAAGLASRIAATGRSNGGLLASVALTQRPDLYAAVLIGVPLTDMRRYSHLLAGASWIAEYGDPDRREDWAYLARWSPYHNIRRNVPYPRPLIYTSTKDDRVHPAHARKFAARLEQLGHDFDYYENIEGGHAGTADKSEEAYRVALLFTYLRRAMVEPADGGLPRPAAAGAGG